MSELRDAAGVARRGRRRPVGRRAAGADPRRRAARPRPGPVADAPAAAAAPAGVGPRRMRRRGRADPSRLAPVPARPRAFGAGDRRDQPRRARPRRGRRPRRRAVAAGRGRADRGRPARQPQGRAAPAGRADRPRGGPPERRRLHPFARPGRHSPPAGGGAARQPAELLGGGTARRRVAARPHAGDLVPDRPAVRRRVGPRRVAADAPARHEAARPGRARSGPGTCGARSTTGAAASRWQGEDAVLVFDDGLGGFLPLSAADLSCEPLSLASAGIVPAPSTPDGDGRGRLRRQADPARALPALAARRRRRGLRCAGCWRAPRAWSPRSRSAAARPPISPRSTTMALELATQGLAAAWPLGSSLRYYREQWERHVRRESCPEGLCLERRAAPCHGTCPANIDIPSFMAHLGHGDYRSTIEVIRRDNPLPLTCGLVCPAPCESACVRGGQRRRRLHPADEGQGGRALPRRGRLPETRDRARHRQADRHRRLRPVQPHGGLLPAHPRPRRRDPRGAGEGRRDAALRHPGLPPPARPARAGDRPDPGAGRPDPHQLSGREPRGVPQGVRRRLPRPRHAEGAPAADRRRPSSLRARRHRLPARRAQRRDRCGSGRGSSSSAAATSPSTSP